MKHLDKQPRRPSKADVSLDKLLPAADVAPQATAGGDKERTSPMPRRLKGSDQPRATPAKKPGR
ncbi:MAG: hypothetical protein JWQ13_3159 [Ramlibacter sp.]|nr:hypothetical protein [Ramlibacter sp.]